MGKKQSGIPEDVNKELESPKFGKPTEITASGYVLDINEKDGKVDILHSVTFLIGIGHIFHLNHALNLRFVLALVHEYIIEFTI